MPFLNNKNNTLVDESVAHLVVGEVGKEKIVFSDIFTTTEASAAFSLVESNYKLLRDFTIGKESPYRLGHKFVVLAGDKLLAYRAIPGNPWDDYTITDWDNLTDVAWDAPGYTIDGEIRCSLSILVKDIV